MHCQQAEQVALLEGGYYQTEKIRLARLAQGHDECPGKFLVPAGLSVIIARNTERFDIFYSKFHQLHGAHRST